MVLATQGQIAGAAKPSTSTSTQTAQSIWTNFKSSGSDSTFGYTESETYAFNDSTAGTYYSVTITGPTVGCSGSPTNCAGTNQPATPAVPATPSFSMDRSDECHFWAGSALTTVSKEASVTVKGLNNNGNWTFTWTFTWTPTTVPDAGTAWDLVASDSPGGASVTFTGQIAGLSAQKTSKTAAPKYSFSLLNSDGTSRVTNAAVSVDGGASLPVDSSVVNALAANFAEFSIGSGYGLSTLLSQNGTTSILTTGDARTILNSDSFAGNDNGGSSGDALAFAQLSAVKLLLTEGSHSVTLAANVKDNAGSTSVSVSVTRGVRIQGLGNCA